MKALNPTHVPLSGVQLIEASAGTGKTFTITTLYLRLLLERELSVSQILVVTFTRAATAELKERIRGRISDALAALRGAPLTRDPALKAYLDARATQSARDHHLLSLALNEFDRAAISTIHGFCNRTLNDRAFESRIDFDAELVEGEDLELELLVRDWWTRSLHSAPPAAARYLQKKFTLKRLMQLASLASRDHDVPIIPQIPIPDLADIGRAVSESHAAWAALMKHAGEEALALLINMNANLHQTTLSVPKVNAIFESLSRYIEAPSPRMKGMLERITHPYLLKKTKSKCTTPEHGLFDAATRLFEVMSEEEVALQTYGTAALYDLSLTCRHELTSRHAARGTLTHNLLLTRLRFALRGSYGEGLAKLLRAQHPAALIDEFQDTDPVQYEVFQRIYAGSGSADPEERGASVLFQIGDPKQAIYGFRGADIFAYLRAARASNESRYTLLTNWRSDPRYIAALNALYSRATSPFAFGEIAYHTVQAPEDREDRLLESGASTAALEVLWASVDDDAPQPLDGTKPIATDFGKYQLPARVAEDILGLLASDVQIDGKAMRPNDIAILCSTNEQLERVERALIGRGIPAVRRGVGSVHQSETARELALLLHATLYPNDIGVVRSALVTVLLGLSVAELLRLEESPDDWNRWAEQFHHARDIWHRQGVMPMIQHLERTREVTRRLLRRSDGQRRLTDLRHLAELLHRQATEKGLSPISTLSWLDAQRRDKTKCAEAELRIETDDPAVQLITIHKSKGLEFPIVYLPYLFDDVRKKAFQASSRVYHAPEADNEARILLGAGHDLAAEAQHELEETAENLRKLYVALTRARHRTVIVWGQFAWANKTALGQLFHAPQTAASTMASTIMENLKGMTEAARRTDVDQLADASDGLIRIRPLPFETTATHSAPEAPVTDRQARSFSRRLGAPWRVTSFSGLAHHARTKGWVDSHRDVDLHGGAQEVRLSSPDDTTIAPLGLFPAGPQVGNLIHEVLEHTDFQTADEAALTKLIEPRLSAANIPLSFMPMLTQGLLSSLDAPLGHALGGLGLRSIPHSRRIDEMEFLYPLKYTRGPSGSPLATAFREMSAIPDYAKRIEMLTPRQLRGYLRGFIDLIFEHEGRWYVVDYKSNYLGPHPKDYAPERLGQAMLKHDYFLQYHLYAVALLRFLRLRVGAFDPAEHFGGVYYLFLRGMTREGPEGGGVYFDRPSPALLDRLDRALCAEVKP